MPLNSRMSGGALLLCAVVGVVSVQTGQGQPPASAPQKAKTAAPRSTSTLPFEDFRFRGISAVRSKRAIRRSSRSQLVLRRAPNIVYILIDDAGYGQFGTFGGAIPTPALDRVANDGLKFTRFHTTALCSPTRAALLTGRNHHVAGTGVITEAATGYDGYTGIIGKNVGTMAEVLRQHGYATSWFGKNHNTPDWETSQVGPFDRWPSGLGFDYFYYGFMGGTSISGIHALREPPVGPRFDRPGVHPHGRSGRQVDQLAASDPLDRCDKAVFPVHGDRATHAPHHVRPKFIAPFKGKFDAGWDAYREQPSRGRRSSESCLPMRN